MIRERVQLLTFIKRMGNLLVTATEEDENFILKNQIGQAIFKRIIRAHEERDENFKIIVLMPLMPAFPADLSTKEAASAR